MLVVDIICCSQRALWLILQIMSSGNLHPHLGVLLLTVRNCLLLISTMRKVPWERGLSGHLYASHALMILVLGIHLEC